MRILIIGAGDTGRHLAKMLSGKGNEVIVVDKNKDKCKLVAEEADVLAINKDIAGLIQSFIEGKYSLINISPIFSGTYGLVSITLAENDTSIGKTLDDLKLPLASKVIAVFDGEKFLDPEEVRELRPGYEVIALVRNDIVEEFIRAFR